MVEFKHRALTVSVENSLVWKGILDFPGASWRVVCGLVRPLPARPTVVEVPTRPAPAWGCRRRCPRAFARSALSIQVARSLHFLVLCWFLMFIVLHVTLVLTTGALRNLNPCTAPGTTDPGSAS